LVSQNISAQNSTLKALSKDDEYVFLLTHSLNTHHSLHTVGIYISILRCQINIHYINDLVFSKSIIYLKTQVRDNHQTMLFQAQPIRTSSRSDHSSQLIACSSRSLVQATLWSPQHVSLPILSAPRSLNIHSPTQNTSPSVYLFNSIELSVQRSIHPFSY